MGNIESLMKILRFLNYCRVNYMIKIYVIIISVVITFITLLDPILYKLVVDEFLLGKNIEIFIVLGVLYIVKTVFFNIFTIAKNYLQVYLGFFITLKIRREMVNKIINMDIKEEKNEDPGDILVSFDSDIGIIEKALSSYIFDILLYCFQITGITLILFVMSKTYFFFVLLFRLLFLLINNRVWIKYLRKNYRNYKNLNSKLFSFVSDTANSFHSIKLMSKEKYIEKSFFKRLNTAMKALMDYKKTVWFMTASEHFLAHIDRVVLWGVGAYLFINGDINMGTYLAIVVYEEVLKLALKHVMSLNISFNPVIVAIERVERVFKFEKEEYIGEKKEYLKGDIELRNLTFSYEEGKEIFSDINMKIKAGEKIAIVGKSESGKTTLVNLILGLIKPDSGEVYLDGVDIKKNINLNIYRKKVGFSGQVEFFFKGSLKDNILLGAKKSKEEFDEIVKNSCMKNLFLKSEKKQLELNGGNLSGGEKQRVAFARIFAKNPDMLIFDEASSALDTVTAREIIKNINRIYKEKTVISVSHRLETVKNSDRIFVIDSAKIVEEGRHEELLKRRGYYYDIFNQKV